METTFETEVGGTRVTHIAVLTADDIDDLDRALSAAEPGTALHVAQYDTETGEAWEAQAYLLVEYQRRARFWTALRCALARRPLPDLGTELVWVSATDGGHSTRTLLVATDKDLDEQIVSACTLVAPSRVTAREEVA